MRNQAAVENSALWAAYGDALGFITEFADSSLVQRRVNNSNVTHTEPWTRLIGGRFGAYANLPAGAYSDDTQLRLATSRAVDNTGHFDAEAFAKVELPVWLAYSLGAGISSKLAATNLSRPNVTWFSNFYSSQSSDYLQAGGNGAAMRIQPLIWSAQGHIPVSAEWLLPVLKNSLITHGHPTALVGALFHAFCLDFALRQQKLPSAQACQEFLSSLRNIRRLVETDPELHNFWLPTWESLSKRSISVAFVEALSDHEGDLYTLVHLPVETPFSGYVQAIGAHLPQFRGSGFKTALLAIVLGWRHEEVGPEKAIIEAANCLICDTDSIATMVGALLGALARKPPVAEVQDRDYIIHEARRMVAIANRSSTKLGSFIYPDLLKWSPPRSQTDSVKVSETGVTVKGLGRGVLLGDQYEPKSGDAAWQWVKLDFGQTILAKRKTIRSTTVAKRAEVGSTQVPAPAPVKESQKQLFISEALSTQKEGRRRSLDELTTEAIRSGFTPLLIGQHLLEITAGANGIEDAIGYAAVIAKARLSRVRIAASSSASK